MTMSARVEAPDTGLGSPSANLFQCLGNERRLRVLEALMPGERHVGALVAAAGIPQNQVSTALAEFASLRLVHRRRDGRRVYYTLADERLRALLEVASAISGDPKPAPSTTWS
jgi:DNA-binding transcriptional ArsR family regulator